MEKDDISRHRSILGSLRSALLVLYLNTWICFAFKMAILY